MSDVVVMDVDAEETAAQIAQKISSLEPGTIALRVRAKRGASKWMAKLFAGDAKVSRAARGSAIVAHGCREIKGEIDANGDDIVSGTF